MQRRCQVLRPAMFQDRRLRMGARPEPRLLCAHPTPAMRAGSLGLRASGKFSQPRRSGRRRKVAKFLSRTCGAESAPTALAKNLSRTLARPTCAAESARTARARSARPDSLRERTETASQRLPLRERHLHARRTNHGMAVSARVRLLLASRTNTGMAMPAWPEIGARRENRGTDLSAQTPANARHSALEQACWPRRQGAFAGTWKQPAPRIRT